MYSLKYDSVPDKEEAVECNLITILEINNYEFPPKIDYKVQIKYGINYKKDVITNKNINHQVLDKIIYPEVLLHTKPCFISSIDLYNVIREHIKNNINTKYAKITSDYDFCFTVKKIVPLIEPRKFTYYNIFALTKKARQKLHFGVEHYKEIEIFEMTHEQQNYKSYTPIGNLHAENEIELKEKIDCILDKLITVINEPLTLCPHCSGTGYIQEIKPIDHKDIMAEMGK